MKRIISLLLCALMCCLLLAGCADDAIGADLEEYEQYRKKDTRPAMVLDFYIVTETMDLSADDTVKAIETVTREINAYLTLKYNTTLDIHFVSEADYASVIDTDVAKAGADRADIVLITGEDMFDNLYTNGKLVNLERYYQGKTFGRLNSPEVIAAALLQASVAPDGARYVVPNNRVVGEYGYYLVNKEVAKHFYYSELDFEGMKYDAPAMAELLASLSADIMDVYYALAHVDDAVDACYSGNPVALPEFCSPRSFGAEDLESDFSVTEAILALASSINEDYQAFLDTVNADIAAARAEIAELNADITALRGQEPVPETEIAALGAQVAQLEEKISKLEAIKTAHTAAKTAYNALLASYAESEEAYGAYAATPEYAEYLDELAAHYRFHQFKNEYESLVSATDVSTIDSDPAFLTHDDIGTDYFDRLAYADKYVCIAGAPYITSADAHESSFAIIAQDGTEEANLVHYERCMEVIYALNTDGEFKNLLQYGVPNTHYLRVETYVDALTGTILNVDADGKFTDSEGRACIVDTDNKIYVLDAEGNIPEGAESVGKAQVVTTVSHEGLPMTYHMNMEHTGSVFNAYYNSYGDNDANYWTAEFAVSGKIQNKDALILDGYCSDPFYCIYGRP